MWSYKGIVHTGNDKFFKPTMESNTWWEMMDRSYHNYKPMQIIFQITTLWKSLFLKGDAAYTWLRPAS